MNRFAPALLLALMFVGLAPPARAADGPEGVAPALRVDLRGEAFVLTTPSSPLTLWIPKGPLVQVQEIGARPATPSTRFVALEDGLEVTVRIEAQPASGNMQAFWKDEAAARKRDGLPAATNVAFARVGDWETVTYDVALPRAVHTSLRAHFVRAGTRIDVLCTLAAPRVTAGNRTYLEGFLRSLAVSQAF